MLIYRAEDIPALKARGLGKEVVLLGTQAHYPSSTEVVGS
jgi:hypothetical protein